MERTVPITTTNQPIKDEIIMKQIQATHAPDGREVDVKPLLVLVEDILHCAEPSIDGVKQDSQAKRTNSLEDMTHNAGFNFMPESFAYDIHRISCELSCKCSGTGGDAKAAIMTIFNTLSSYTWDAKVVLALAAFAVNYVELSLVRQFCTTKYHHLAKSVSLLKNLSDHNMENSSILQPFFKLVKTMLDVTNSIVKFKELPTQYITLDTPTFFMAQSQTIPTAAYLTIRSVVACATQIVGLTVSAGSSYESTISSMEVTELSNTHDKLKQQLCICYKHIDERRSLEAYKTVVNVFETIHMDNMKILTTLIYAKDDKQLLFDRLKETKQKVSIDVLRGKIVLLLISDLDISKEVLEILEQIYNESDTQYYEVVWLPIVDRSTPFNNDTKEKFDKLVSKMPWYKVCDLSLLDRSVIKYIKEEWHFKKRPLLVALDAQGKVVCPNAIDMTLIWGSKAFPFSSTREKDLWMEEPWRLESLEDNIGQDIIKWIREEKYICLYGGDDGEWITEFTKKAISVAKEANIPFEMVYVGKSTPKERVGKIVGTIKKDKQLGHCLRDLTSIRHFWVRLESIWYSKMQRGKTVKNDEAMKEIETMLAFNSSDQGWAVIFKGSKDMIKANGKTLLDCFKTFNWGEVKAGTIGFLPAIEEYIKKNHTAHHCNSLSFSVPPWRIPEMMACAECVCPMVKCTMYQCCTD
ncbi:hypothetical protein HHK36_029527 [Tetracentron sinense]|uniref:Protein SIEVE ELEMENT OCCLUSION B-like n=1 Tax=Tetracentron sinense TaxID=13715 RepID=A0A835CZT9_TETSI|nr:hypothetical protein HHK36_029527 [Tetracentron sinense]